MSVTACDGGVLTEIWASLHRSIDFQIPAAQRHYFSSLAMMIDDELTARLLLKKLKFSRFVEDEQPDLVTLDKVIEFTFGNGLRERRQLIHPTAQTDFPAIRSDTLVGAGLIGLRAGQTILWPDSRGLLTDLKVIAVHARPARAGARFPGMNSHE